MNCAPTINMSNVLRRIPPVHELLDSCLEEVWAEAYSRDQLLKMIREELKDLRQRTGAGFQSS